MVNLWSICGHFVVILWSFCGHFVAILWSICGQFVAILWSICGHEPSRKNGRRGSGEDEDDDDEEEDDGDDDDDDAAADDRGRVRGGLRFVRRECSAVANENARRRVPLYTLSGRTHGRLVLSQRLFSIIGAADHH